MTADARIPVTILERDALAAWLEAGGAAALVVDGPETPPGFVATERFDARPPHRFGCGCCAGRSGAALALDRLFQGRVRGRTAWFDRVAVLPASEMSRQQAAAALADDVLTFARFRPG